AQRLFRRDRTEYETAPRCAGRARAGARRRGRHRPRSQRVTSVLRSVVTGVGGYLPERVVTNDDLAKVVDTSDEWIVERTGIRQRHFSGPNETAAFMGAAA